jgi:hypothetical protein
MVHDCVPVFVNTTVAERCPAPGDPGVIAAPSWATLHVLELTAVVAVGPLVVTGAVLVVVAFVVGLVDPPPPPPQAARPKAMLAATTIVILLRRTGPPLIRRYRSLAGTRCHYRGPRGDAPVRGEVGDRDGRRQRHRPRVRDGVRR